MMISAYAYFPLAGQCPQAKSLNVRKIPFKIPFRAVVVTVRRSTATLSVCPRTSYRIVLFANRICIGRFWLHEHCGCTIVHVQTFIHTLRTAQCICFGTTTWIRPTRSAYGGGESGRETNVPPKHLNAEKNG